MILIITYYIISTENQKHKLKNMANTDQLTGLYNTRHFITVLNEMAENNQSFAVYYMDLNKFKSVNDNFGHAVGDKVLIETGRRITNFLGKGDAAFRIGGDEFTIILSSDKENNSYEKMKTSLEKAFESPFIIDTLTLNVTASCGYARYPQDTNDIEKLLQTADQNMYQEKIILKGYQG